MKETRHGNECKETRTYYILSFTGCTSTNFNNYIFECSSDEGGPKTTRTDGIAEASVVSLSFGLLEEYSVTLT